MAVACTPSLGQPFCEQPFIFFVRTDPEPHDLVRRSPDTNRAVLAADADRNEAIRAADLLKSQARVTGVLKELTVSRPCLAANLARQDSRQLPKARRDVRIHSRSGVSGVVRPCACSFRASSANRSTTLLDFANSSAHRRSDSISASNHAPIVSCSFSGSFDASEIAFSSSLPISSPCHFWCSYRSRCLVQSRPSLILAV